MTHPTEVTLFETLATTNSFYNHTSFAEEAHNFDDVVYIVFLSILILVGLSGNTLTIIVLSKQRNRKVSTATLYICLAVSDLHIVITSTLVGWMYYVVDVIFLDGYVTCIVLFK